MNYLQGIQVAEAQGPGLAGSAAERAESRVIWRTGNITWPKGHIGSHVAWALTRHKSQLELWWRTAQNETSVVSRPDHDCYLWFTKGTVWPLPNIPNKSVLQNDLGPQESLAP